MIYIFSGFAFLILLALVAITAASIDGVIEAYCNRGGE